MLRGAALAVLLVMLAFTTLYFVTGEDGGPGGSLFALLALHQAALWAAKAMSPIKQLPPLLTMLVVGFALGNLPFLGEHVGRQVDSNWSAGIRQSALVLILLRAGMALDINALKRLRFVVPRLAAAPCLSEAATAAALASALLDLPVLWAAMLGFVVAAISPAVVVPSLLSLQERGYGVSTGIPSLVVASAPLDDVLSIAGFGICLGLALTEESPVLSALRAPLEILLGLGSGLLGAAVLVLLMPADEDRATKGGPGREERFLSLLGLALTTSFGLGQAGFSGAAALAVLALGAASARGWKEEAKPVVAVVTELWNRLAQPLLFSLVGASVDVRTLESNIVGSGLAILAGGGAVRFAVAAAATSGRGLRCEEKLFTAMAWMPKATVQAAIGGVALDRARTPEERTMGQKLLAVAVLAILLTAPLGAILIQSFGPRLLTKEPEENCEKPEDDQQGRSAAPPATMATADCESAGLQKDKMSL
ncbi:Mitochondrial sodium/hydrogen exchanger 9B2 [Symbiodinium microadriaticum]|uniref:Mitochondrial sodium/hydrogen exchanger 9B2 n=2 Tax=Symbiodinium TaxID=2949 RepID=A0A1Q9ECU9_SYMMI|nr:Mitochondrial sodium/hydrogen exchanger 9B2 [Symbiodinium microadriaticum]